MNLNNIALGYESVALNYPKKFDMMSRVNCDTSVELGRFKFKIPVIPANMSCVISPEIAANMARNGYFHILHRFHKKGNLFCLDEYMHWWKMHNDNDIKWLQKAASQVPQHAPYYDSISLGIKVPDEDIVDGFAATGQAPNFITIDIAHGHQTNALTFLEWAKSKLPKTFFIVGNVCTPEAVIDLENAGADAIKVGIGPGKACTTFLKTGFMSPMFTTVQRCAAVAKKPIIADGGIRSNGDITKALVAGATMVMAGSIFTVCKDSPATTEYTPGCETINEKFNRWVYGIDTRPYIKHYYGSASVYNKGNVRNIEGALVKLQGNGMTYSEKLQEIEQDLQSAISYAGGWDLKALNGLKYDVIL